MQMLLGHTVRDPSLLSATPLLVFSYAWSITPVLLRRFYSSNSALVDPLQRAYDR